MTLVLTVLFGTVQFGTARAAGCDEAEYRRLSREQARLAERNAWSGVERTYTRLIDTRCELSAAEHRLAAESARVLGKTLEQVERLEVALALEDDADTRAQLESIVANFGRVEIDGDARRPPELRRDSLPFAPDQRKSIEYARTVLLATGSFVGMLPAGDYRVGDVAFLVEPGDESVQRISVSGRSGPPDADRGLVRYVGPVAWIGPNLFATPETDREIALSDGGDQFSPASVAAVGLNLSAGVELGLTYGEPVVGVAAGLDYAGGYGRDTLHAVAAWSMVVVRPGDARFAIGPQYRMVFGDGTGVAAWFDRGQPTDPESLASIPFSGVAWGGGLQAWAGYAPLEFGALQGVVEVGGSWHTDLARSYFTLGLRLGIVPHIKRFEG